MTAVNICAKVDEGLTLQAADGTQLHLAIVDPAGNIVTQGARVSTAILKAAVSAYDAFWSGSGHLTTITPLPLE